jgi:hypothetical protein
MKKLFACFVAVAFVLWAGSAFAASNVGVRSEPPVVTGMGGPDAYGYTWIDNDSAGGPAFQWVDITTKPGAVEVTSMLGDDNNCGLFPIGFDFPYYWYTVDEVIIGSNGYVSFSDRDNFAHPFSDLPSEARPNNLVCPLTGDIDFTAGTPECWYWSNGVDSFVVSWIEVPEFYPDHRPDSTHTFQLILTAADSSLYFMYGQQKGHFEGGSGEYVIGMEDVSGTVGLQYCRTGMPAGNVFHPDLAIRWHPVPDPTFEFYDLGVLNAMSDGSLAEVYFSGDEVTLMAEYKNNGTHPQTDIETRVIVRDPSGTELMRDTVIIASLDRQESKWVEYDRKLTTTVTGEYSVEFRLYVVDEVPANNRKIFELRVLDFNGIGSEALFLWDDTTLESCSSWQGDSGGYANEFEVRGDYAFKIKEAHIPIQGVSGGAGGDLVVRIVEEDEFGNPGEIIAQKIEYIPFYEYFQWKYIDFTGEDITVNPNEKIWVVGIHATETTFAFCHDATYTSPRSNRGFEYTGMVSPDRNRETQDVAIRILVQWAPQTGVEDDDYTSELPDRYLLTQNYPNPFNAKTSITYQVPKASDVKLEVYNLTGQKVATLVNGIQTAGRHVVTWDASEAASGIYFYKLSAGDHTSMKRMALLK